MRNRISLTIRCHQRGDNQCAPHQVGGITEGADNNVNFCALALKGRQCRGHNDGGDVFRFQRVVACIDAETLQHGRQALFGKGRIPEGISSPVQPDHEAVSDQDIVANALKIGDVLNAGGGIGGIKRPEKTAKCNNKRCDRTQARFGEEGNLPGNIQGHPSVPLSGD